MGPLSVFALIPADCRSTVSPLSGSGSGSVPATDKIPPLLHWSQEPISLPPSFPSAGYLRILAGNDDGAARAAAIADHAAAAADARAAPTVDILGIAAFKAHAACSCKTCSV